MIEHDRTPEYLYKIVAKGSWEQSSLDNRLHLSPMDDPFVHLATKEQLPHVAEKFWQGIDHVILKIAASSLEGRLEHETNPGGTTKYFHLYEGSIPFNAIVEIRFSG